MSGWIKKYWWVLLIAFVAIVAPLVMNWIILKPQKFQVVGDGTHWLGFWVTYISAIASFAMVFITWRSLRQMQLQWNEQKRARLSFSIIPSQSWYALKISNIGQETAFNIDVRFNTNFIDNIPIDNAKKFFLKINDSLFSLEAGRSKYLLICECEGSSEYWKEKCEEVLITGTYCINYEVDETINILEYTIGGSVVDDELTTVIKYIKKGLIVQNDSYMPIQKSLDIIANKIDNVLPKEKIK